MVYVVNGGIFQGGEVLKKSSKTEGFWRSRRRKVVKMEGRGIPKDVEREEKGEKQKKKVRAGDKTTCEEKGFNSGEPEEKRRLLKKRSDNG